MGDSQELDASPRLIFLLRKIRDGLAQSLDSIKQAATAADGTLPHLQVDGQDVKEAALCLRDAGLEYAGLRLAHEFDQLCNRCMDEWFAAMADGESKEDRDKLTELFGPFPNDSFVEDRMVAIVGCAAQLAEFVGELVDSQPPAKGDGDENSSDQQEKAISSQRRGKRQEISRLPDRTENEIRAAIEKALDDQQHGILVKMYQERITKAEVAARCPNVGKDHIKHSEEWKFYREHGYLRPRGNPSEAERESATRLLHDLLPEHQHLEAQMAGMDGSLRLEYLSELTRSLVPVTKLPKGSQVENGHMVLKQFADNKSEKVHPLVTVPGENTPAVSRFDTDPPDEN